MPHRGAMSSPWNPICDPPRRLVRPVPIDVDGRRGPTLNQARGPRWRRASRGLYVPASVDASVPEQRVLEASMRLPTHGAVTGWAALRLRRAAYFDGLMPDGRTQRPVLLSAGPRQSRRAQHGIRWSETWLADDEVWHPLDIPSARLLRALFDEMRTSSDVRSAAVAMDMAAAADLTSIRRMNQFTERRAGWEGVPVVRRGLELADECSRSPGESRLRLSWVLDTPHPRPLTNREVFGAGGQLLGIADLIDPEAGVVGEYDGAEHARAGRRSRDAARDSAFRDHGLEVFRVTGYDEHHPELVRGRIGSAYERAARLRMPRRWTLQPPAGWQVAPSLDEQLDLQDVLRSLHLQAG